MRVAAFPLTLLALAGLAAASDIDGKVMGWPAHQPHPREAVVWLDGAKSQPASKAQPVMAQHGGEFVPRFLVVVAGQTVRMPNEDEVAHSVYSLSASNAFDLGFYAKGDPKTVTFELPGVVEVLCVIHHFMRAKILVVPNGSYAIVAADGSFHIRNAPAGTTALTFWADGITAVSQQVTVPKGSKSVTVQVSLPDSKGSQ